MYMYTIAATHANTATSSWIIRPKLKTSDWDLRQSSFLVVFLRLQQADTHTVLEA